MIAMDWEAFQRTVNQIDSKLFYGLCCANRASNNEFIGLRFEGYHTMNKIEYWKGFHEMPKTIIERQCFYEIYAECSG